MKEFLNLLSESRLLDDDGTMLWVIAGLTIFVIYAAYRWILDQPNRKARRRLRKIKARYNSTRVRLDAKSRVAINRWRKRNVALDEDRPA